MLATFASESTSLGSEQQLLPVAERAVKRWRLDTVCWWGIGWYSMVFKQNEAVLVDYGRAVLV